MPTPLDDDDRLASGTFPDDPEADTAPIDAPPSIAAPAGPQRLGELLAGAFARTHARHNGEEKPIPVPWPTLAAALGGGLWPGLHVLVGNPATGKTQWCLQTAINAAQRGTPVLYVALDASELEFVARCLGRMARISWSELYYGRREDLATLFEKHKPALDELPLDVIFAPPHGLHYNKLLRAVEALRQTYLDKTHGNTPVLVVIDFIQIIGGNSGEDLRERIGRAASVCRGVARELNAAVLVACSTARENYSRLGEREKLGEGTPARLVGLGKESGELESAADTVLVLARDQELDVGTVFQLALAKVRAGTPTWVPLRFDGQSFTPPLPPERIPGVPAR